MILEHFLAIAIFYKEEVYKKKTALTFKSSSAKRKTKQEEKKQSTKPVPDFIVSLH